MIIVGILDVLALDNRNGSLRVWGTLSPSMTDRVVRLSAEKLRFTNWVPINAILATAVSGEVSCDMMFPSVGGSGSVRKIGSLFDSIYGWLSVVSNNKSFLIADSWTVPPFVGFRARARDSTRPPWAVVVRSNR